MNQKVKELLKSVHICQSYRQKIKVARFLWPTVYRRSSKVPRRDERRLLRSARAAGGIILTACTIPPLTALDPEHLALGTPSQLGLQLIDSSSLEPHLLTPPTDLLASCSLHQQHTITISIITRKPCYRRENCAMPLYSRHDTEFYNGIVRFPCHSIAFLIDR